MSRVDAKKPQHAIRDPQWRLRILLVIVLLLVIAKAWTLGAFFMLSPSGSVTDLFSQDVVAQTIEEDQDPADVPAEASVDDTAPDRPGQIAEDFTWSYDLVLALQKRDEELRVREYALQKEEERIEIMKNTLDDRIKMLSRFEVKITELVDQKTAVENEKMQKLAKVFEETPPEQAGPLISRLDVDIAAQLILRMNNRKAGRMWGFVEAQQAVKISEELARLNPGYRISPVDQ
jgi:flagellar motility protein MotE (MotC chaperone)